jgi:hypothetical protein
MKKHRSFFILHPFLRGVPMSEEASADRTRCMHLCCKSMVVYGEAFESDPDYQAGITDFWCIRTSKGYGPDGGRLSLDLCSNADRTCYQEY